MSIKSKVKLLLKHNSWFERFFRVIYVFLNNKNFLEHRKSFGNENIDKTIFLIRPNSEDGIQGLMSLFTQTMRKIDYARKNGYIPVVDFKNYKTQYWNGKDNAWEFFFKQPSDVSLEMAYKSRNVILSGASLNKRENMKLFKETIFYDKCISKYCNKIIFDNIKLSENVLKSIKEEKKKIDVDRSIGVYIRGTDYVKLKPVGEYVQPSISEVIDKINEFLNKYPEYNIFLVTEDKEYYEILKEKYGNKLKTVSFDSFINRKKVNTYLSKTDLLNNDVVKRGRDYLVKEILLAECKCLISSITCGSIAAFAFNGDKYQEKYIFNKGVYK